MFSPLNSDRLLPVLFLPCFWAEIDPMYTKDLKIELLIILAGGLKNIQQIERLGHRLEGVSLALEFGRLD